MKFAIVVLAVVAAASAQYNPNPFKYNPFPQPKRPYNAPIVPVRSYPTPAPVFPQYVSSTFAPPAVIKPVVARVSNVDSRNANILKSGNEIYPDGSYNYFYENDNGIAAQEQGTPRNFGGNPPVVPVVAQGSFSFTSPEGRVVSINYVADENGFQPTGDVIPTPHPIPEQIQRSLAYIAQNYKN